MNFDKLSFTLHFSWEISTLECTNVRLYSACLFFVNTAEGVDFTNVSLSCPGP